MDHNHLKKERGTWPVSILPALQSIDSNGNQSHLCCKLLYMCSTLLDVNNSGHTTTQSGIGNFMCCHFVPRTSEPLETRLMESGIHLQCPSCTPTWKWTPGISYTEFLAACLEDRSSPLSQGFFFALDHTWPHCQERHYTQEAAFWHAFRLHLIHCVLIISALEMILWIGWGFRASFLCYESIRKLASASWIPLCLSKESPMWIFTVNYPPLPPPPKQFCRFAVAQSPLGHRRHVVAINIISILRLTLHFVSPSTWHSALSPHLPPSPLAFPASFRPLPLGLNFCTTKGPHGNARHFDRNNDGCISKQDTSVANRQTIWMLGTFRQLSKSDMRLAQRSTV